jgi:PhnB protein
VTPHLTFPGNCRETFAFYAQLFNGKIETMMIWGESPLAAHVSAAEQSAVMHARVEFNGQSIAGADTVGGPHPPIQGVYLILEPDSIAEAERLFTALASGGHIDMPLAETFWAARYGMVRDRFGVPWEINCGNKP